MAGALQPMEVLTMRPAPLRPAAAPATTSAAVAQPQRYLTNDEAADYLRLLSLIHISEPTRPY